MKTELEAGVRSHSGPLAGLGRRLRGMFADRRGVAAVEFALIAPIILTLYFVTVEATQAIATDKKVGRVAGTSADLISQQLDSVSRADLDAILQIGGAVLQPYNRSQPTVTATGIQVSTGASPKAQVVWSRQLANGVSGGGPSAPGSAATIPADLLVSGNFVIRVEAQLSYMPMIAWTAQDQAGLGLLGAFSTINMDQVYYLRPRMSQSIACPDC